MTFESECYWIDNERALTAWIASQNGSTCLAIDTEFERTKTYFPELQLVQIATPSSIALIDYLSLQTTFLINQALSELGNHLILHASKQDLEVLSLNGINLCSPLFDTQIAAALAGMSDQIGYATLVRETLGVHLKKGETRSDWGKRPLSQEQLNYAANDVRYLIPVLEELKSTLKRLGRFSWFEEECSALSVKVDLETLHGSAWRKLKGLRGLAPNILPIAIELARWREKEAISLNIPRSWFLSDKQLVSIAKCLPSSITELASAIPADLHIVRKYGAEILQLVRHPSITDNSSVSTEILPNLTSRQREMVRELMLQVQNWAARLQVSPQILATKKELEDLVRGKSSARLFDGWRKNHIPKSLSETIASFVT